jgi:hypothetical protein
MNDHNFTSLIDDDIADRSTAELTHLWVTLSIAQDKERFVHYRPIIRRLLKKLGAELEKREVKGTQ